MDRVWKYLFLKILSDIIVVNIAFIGAFLIKFKTVNFLPVMMIYYKPLLFITALWLVVLNLAGLYKPQHDKVDRRDNILSVSFGAFSAAFFTYVFVVFLYREAAYSKEIVMLGSFASLVLINISRYMIWKLFQKN
jgi:FlaA1/EpsC-like NDP-sugar epimerase